MCLGVLSLELLLGGACISKTWGHVLRGVKYEGTTLGAVCRWCAINLVGTCWARFWLAA